MSSLEAFDATMNKTKKAGRLQIVSVVSWWEKKQQKQKLHYVPFPGIRLTRINSMETNKVKPVASATKLFDAPVS